MESGKLPWKQLLRQFYGGFESNLHQVEKDMEGVYLKVPDEVTEEKCDLCGRNMVIKSGRFGRFLACPGYPECKFTKPLVVEMPGRCPVCGGRLMKRTGVSKKSGKQYNYYCCEKFPACSFVTFDVPVKDDCPVCGHTMFKKSGRGSSVPSASTRRAKISCRRISEAIPSGLLRPMGRKAGQMVPQRTVSRRPKLSKRRHLTSPPPRKPPQLRKLRQRKAPLRKPARPKPPPKNPRPRRRAKRLPPP